MIKDSRITDTKELAGIQVYPDNNWGGSSTLFDNVEINSNGRGIVTSGMQGDSTLTIINSQLNNTRTEAISPANIYFPYLQGTGVTFNNNTLTVNAEMHSAAERDITGLVQGGGAAGNSYKVNGELDGNKYFAISYANNTLVDKDLYPTVTNNDGIHVWGGFRPLQAGATAPSICAGVAGPQNCWSQNLENQPAAFAATPISARLPDQFEQLTLDEQPAVIGSTLEYRQAIMRR